MTYLDHELRKQGVSEDVIKLRRLRRNLKVTVSELAAVCGVSYTQLQRYELGDIQSKELYDKVHAVLDRWEDWIDNVRANRKPEARGRKCRKKSQ